MKSAIVTGGTGFIGSFLIQELIAEGYRVTVPVRNRERLLPELLQSPFCEVVEGELCDLSPSDFSEGEYDLCFHLAWGGVDTQHKNDLELQMKNIELSLKMLELAHALGCRRFLASGTVAEYVLCENIMDLNAKQTPGDFYGAAKVSAHYFLEVRARQLGLDFLWAVIPSTFGERRKDNNIITYTITSLLKGERPVYGNLTQMWDFLYVSEVVRALRLIGECGKTGKVYGIGSGQYKPLRHYIETIRDLIDPALPLGIGELPARPGQPVSSCVNIYDLISDAGFSPSVSFEDGIRRTVAYWREQLG